MYKSPIEVVLGELRTEIGNEIDKVIQEAGVLVDKEELNKALEYDRQQYEKGYEDGKAEHEVVRCRDCVFWEKKTNSLQGRCCLFQIYPTGTWFCANGRDNKLRDDNT